MLKTKQVENKYSFICNFCNFKCCYESQYDRHVLTAKHKMLTNANIKTIKNKDVLSCVCGKTYKHQSSLCKHKKICPQINASIARTDTEEKPSIMEILSQNKELMNLLVVQNQEHRAETSKLHNTIQEMIPKIGNNNNNNTTNNNQFNLQVFLNEDCKDAINFSEFIQKIQVSFEDLENQAENGYIKGISRLFIENLQELGTHKRPIHCTDKKRNTLYIKENNSWDKEGSQDSLKKGIQEVTRKTQKKLLEEKENNSEEYNDADSEFFEKCISIQRSLIPDAPRDTTINKVIENISKTSGLL